MKGPEDPPALFPHIPIRERLIPIKEPLPEGTAL